MVHDIFRIYEASYKFIIYQYHVLYTYHLSCIQGVPKKLTNRMMLEPWCTGSITSGRQPLGLENVFGRLIILRLCRIKCSPAMCLVKFSPTALNFVYDFFFLLLVTFFWDTLYHHRIFIFTM